MLVIRLLRTGRKNQPFFKIIVTEKTSPPRGGRFVDEVGYYNPLSKERKIDGEKVKQWIAKGAKPSDTLHNMLITEKIIEGTKIAMHKKSKKPAETPTEKPAEQTPTTETKPEEKSQEEPEKEKTETPTEASPAVETSTEEKKEEPAPTEEKPQENPKEEQVSETPKEETKEEPAEEKKGS